MCADFRTPDYPADGPHSREPRQAIPRFLSRAPRLLAQGTVIGGAAFAGAAILGAAAATAIFAGRRKTRSHQMRGKIVLITGSSRGLGLATAEEFARLGARIVLTARDAEELERARHLLLERAALTTADVIAVPADLSRQEEAEYLVHRALETWGRIDVLVNNAGIITVGPIENQTVEDFRKVMDTNFFSAVHCTLAALPHMLKNRAGTVVNITSIGGKVAVPHLLPYSASKFAAVGFSEGLHAELHGKGIHVLTVCPGLMRTGSHLNALFAGDAAAEYQWFSIGATTPGLAASARHAARRIVRGVLNRETELFITPQAALAGRLAQVTPGMTAAAMSLVNKILPAAGTERPRRGADVRQREAASVRVFGAGPARRYNET
ncbi:MAG TPA: SDR family NAD(P)-dependent oxidoreductase, partial [Terracidiphilus sp.]